MLRSLRSLAALTPPAGEGSALRAPRESARKGKTIMLRIYELCLSIVRRVKPVLDVIRKKDANLFDQGLRALTSMPLNVAEGSRSRGKLRDARYSDACASSNELLAVLQTAEALGYVGRIDDRLENDIRRVIGTLVKNIR